MASATVPTFWRRPISALGWWAFTFALVYIMMNALNMIFFFRLDPDIPWRGTVLPYYGIVMILTGLIAGALGLAAVLLRKERSILVWVSLVMGLSVLILVIGEFAVPH